MYAIRSYYGAAGGDGAVRAIVSGASHGGDVGLGFIHEKAAVIVVHEAAGEGIRQLGGAGQPAVIAGEVVAGEHRLPEIGIVFEGGDDGGAAVEIV